MGDITDEPTALGEKVKRYRVKVGLNYRARGKPVRREAGEVCDDIPAVSLPWLIKQGIIEEIGEED